MCTTCVTTAGASASMAAPAVAAGAATLVTAVHRLLRRAPGHGVRAGGGRRRPEDRASAQERSG